MIDEFWRKEYVNEISEWRNFIFPFTIKIAAQTIEMDLVSVQPMS